MSERLTDFPLFPLGMVALPTEMVPLHIFEERYKTMIGECLTRDSQFGIVWLSDAELAPVGCACEIVQVLSRMDDGRLNIMSRGTQALAVLRRQDELAYPAGEIELLDDDEEDPDSEARQQATDAYAALVEQATDERPDDEALAQLSAYEMAARVDFEADVKQELLTLRSENERLRRLGTLLEEVQGRLEAQERAQMRAQSNGKVRFG